ncbi:MAG: FAD/NAD(P)-binding oxidoreductase [Candidatus Altiarchaeales archaeon]|nr:MAG: FAD/NAD(P)-binding oxidoreductase [Candidatus Altiarchaeales archaeon]HDI73274.1 FAD/NAD(P)-binding oxidoreductase [Candidatus Altiarchaeales archaeon]
MKREFDILIIGGGVVGCAIARELSKYRVNALLVEKECDVAMGISGRNSGVVHAGFYMKPGSLKAELNIKGHRMMPKLCEELDVPYQRVGKLVVAKNEQEVECLYKLKEAGDENGTKNLRIIDKEEIKKLEPNVEGIKALHSPTSAILDPFIFTIALAENALRNGIRILLDTEVLGIEENGSFTVKTTKGEFKSDFVVNSAGLFSDRISEMVGISKYKIYPCRGEYHILDKNKRDLINGMIYPVPPREFGGLGVHLTPTTDDNIFIGPSAEYIGEVDNVANTAEIMERLFKEAKELLPKISKRDLIRSFAGIRPKLIKANSKEPGDFVIEESPDVRGFINLIGIESPGLTAAPAIAEKVVEIIKKKMKLKINQKFKPKRKAPVRFSKLSDREKSELIRKNPNYGEIVCRCETVTKQEIIDALKNPLGARSIYGVRKRSKATCGRCQGGFCIPKIVKIMEELFQPPIDDITLKGEGSQLFIGKTKDLRR